VRAPKANAIAERFVRTVRAECLDWLLIVNRRHLELVLRVFVDHYNTQTPPCGHAVPPEWFAFDRGTVDSAGRTSPNRLGASSRGGQRRFP